MIGKIESRFIRISSFIKIVHFFKVVYNMNWVFANNNLKTRSSKRKNVIKK